MIYVLGADNLDALYANTGISLFKKIKNLKAIVTFLNTSTIGKVWERKRKREQLKRATFSGKTRAGISSKV